MKPIKPLLAIALLALLAACATVPQPLQRPVEAITPEQAREGAQVRWGGRIVEARPLEQQTCFDLIGYAQDLSGRPFSGSDRTIGRFVACKAGFYDPAVFAPGRDITVVGTIAGFEERPVGEYRYKQPRVAAEVIYLWPERTAFDRYDAGRYSPYGRHGFWGPWGPWGPWDRFGPWW